nr:hypothetical protein [Rhodovulum steppense]
MRALARLHGVPQRVIDDAQVGHVAHLPRVRRVQAGSPLPGLGVLAVAKAIPYPLADIELVVQDARAPAYVAVQRVLAPVPHRLLLAGPGRGNPLLVQLRRDLQGRFPLGIFRQDPANDRRFLGNDFERAGDPQPVRADGHPVAVGHPARVLAVANLPGLAAPGLLRQGLQEHRADDPREGHADEIHLALVQRVDLDPMMLHKLPQIGDVQIVAADPIHALGQHDLELALLDILQEADIAGPVVHRARHRPVDILVDDLPAFPAGPDPAFVELIVDRLRVLLVGRIARVEGRADRCVLVHLPPCESWLGRVLPSPR